MFFFFQPHFSVADFISVWQDDLSIFGPEIPRFLILRAGMTVRSFAVTVWNGHHYSVIPCTPHGRWRVLTHCPEHGDEMGPNIEDKLMASDSGFVFGGQRLIISHKLFSLLLICSVLALSFVSLGGFSSSSRLSVHFLKVCFLEHENWACTSSKAIPFGFGYFILWYSFKLFNVYSMNNFTMKFIQ